MKAKCKVEKKLDFDDANVHTDAGETAHADQKTQIFFYQKTTLVICVSS